MGKQLADNPRLSESMGDPVSAAAVEAVSHANAEIKELKRMIDEKEEALKSARSGKPSADPEEKAKLEDKIRQLEGRLSEYEIIEADIADLSFYKEENSKLQQELQALKTSAAGTPAAAVEAALAPVPEAVVAEPLVAEPAATAPVEPPPPAVAEPVVTPVEEMEHKEVAEPEGVVDDALMAEFAAAVQDQKGTPRLDVDKAVSPVPEFDSAPGIETAVTSAAPAAPVSAAASNVINFPLNTEPTVPQAKFELGTAAEPAVGTEAEPRETPAAEPASFDVNMDKMLAEAADISVSVPEGVVETNVLDAALDESKLLEEADALGEVKES
jgi:hypothetical protein